MVHTWFIPSPADLRIFLSVPLGSPVTDFLALLLNKLLNKSILSLIPGGGFSFANGCLVTTP